MRWRKHTWSHGFSSHACNLFTKKEILIASQHRLVVRQTKRELEQTNLKPFKKKKSTKLIKLKLLPKTNHASINQLAYTIHSYPKHDKDIVFITSETSLQKSQIQNFTDSN